MIKRNLIALLLASSFPFAAQAADSYTIDSAHTYPNFKINHLGFSTMHGRFESSTGKITLDLAAKKGSIDILIKAASITTGFAKRDAHLKSPDFFNAAEFPTLEYKSSAIKFKGNTPVSVDGTLTLMGVSKPLTLTINSFKCGTHPMSKKAHCGADASAKFKRSDFGMGYGLPNIGDEVELSIEVEASKD